VLMQVVSMLLKTETCVLIFYAFGILVYQMHFQVAKLALMDGGPNGI